MCTILSIYCIQTQGRFDRKLEKACDFRPSKNYTPQTNHYSHFLLKLTSSGFSPPTLSILGLKYGDFMEIRGKKDLARTLKSSHDLFFLLNRNFVLE